MRDNRNNSKEIIISILSILILIVAVFGISYSIWIQTFSGNKENSINTGYISFSYTESDNNVIKIKNAVPMSDSSGRILTGKDNIFDFTISAKYAGASSIGYEIFLTPIRNSLDGKYVKIYLTDQNDIEVMPNKNIPVYTELEDSSVIGSKTLYISNINESDKILKYRIRVWVSSEYNDPYVTNEFAFKVGVKGVA